MPMTTPRIGRRHALAVLTSAAASLSLPVRFLQAGTVQAPTPRQTEGPFYPADWLGDIDNDLVKVQGAAASAIGQVLHVRGHVFDLQGAPVRDAVVEIWQCDARGIYRHPRDARGSRQIDTGFQGRGRSRTDEAGRYEFRTIKPVAYPGRTPHIHFQVTRPSGAPLTTQMYVFGEPLNERDGVLNGIRDARQRDSVIVRLAAADGIEPDALAGNFDIWLG